MSESLAWSVAGVSVVALGVHILVDRIYKRKIDKVLHDYQRMTEIQSQALEKLLPQVPKEEASKISRQLIEDISKVES